MLSEERKTDGASRASNIQKVPEVNDDGCTNGDKGKETDILGRHVAGQGETGENKPLPPFATERLVTQLVKFNVKEQAASHCQYKGSIQKDQPGLANVSVVKENQSGSNDASRDTIPRLPHDKIGNRHSQGAQNGGKSSECNIRDLVVNVRIANVFEVEVAIVANQPAHEGKEKLGKRRMDIEKVGSFKIIRGKLR